MVVSKDARRNSFGKITSICVTFQVLIEAGSASSFEMSPRFSQNFSSAVTISGGGRHPSATSSSSGGAGKDSKIDLESELQEAMAENVGGGGGEDSLLDGESEVRNYVEPLQRVNHATYPNNAVYFVAALNITCLVL